LFSLFKWDTLACLLVYLNVLEEVVWKVVGIDSRDGEMLLAGLGVKSHFSGSLDVPLGNSDT